MKRLLFVLIFILTLISFSFSYSYSAFSLMTGKNTVAINPFISLDSGGNFGYDIFTAYGITDKIDIWSNIRLIPELNEFDASVMLRYDFTGKNTIAAIRANGKHISPQFHWIWENEKITLQSNIIAQFDYDYLAKPSIYAIISPAFKLFYGMVDIFCEINPGYYMNNQNKINSLNRTKGFGLDIIPGIGFIVGKSLFSISCPIYDITKNYKPTFGAWWFITLPSQEK